MGLERFEGRTAVLVQSGVDTVSYTLDEGLIEFGTGKLYFVCCKYYMYMPVYCTCPLVTCKFISQTHTHTYIHMHTFMPYSLFILQVELH